MTSLNAFTLSFFQKNQLEFDKNERLILAPTQITPELAIKLLRLVIPVTLPTTDLKGRMIQLWSYKSELIASVFHGGLITLIPGNRVYNSLQANEKEEELLERLQTVGVRKWQFAYLAEKQTISVWPQLMAAGKDDISGWKQPSFPKENQQLSHIFNKKGKDGHFTKDTPANRRYIANATSSPHNIRARDAYGKQLYMKTMHDGSQAWAWVNKEGIIASGGRNKRPNIWNQMRTRTIPFYTKSRFKHQSGKTAGVSRALSAAKKAGILALLMSSTLFGKSPANKQFHQLLQQTHLTKSYNGNHPGKPVAARGAGSGQIGGVGMKLGMIEALFKHPEALFEDKHYFMVPMKGEKTPFSERELQQILRELAIGIYTHETVPFFSLEFNQEGHLFPVIHPVYEGTLVGRVIGLLDYMMKGYLNGGVFNERFIDGWRASPRWDRRSALDEMVEFREYVRTECPDVGDQYIPLRLMIDEYLGEKKEEIALKGEKETSDPEFFEDYTRFSNSFRIIAKQGSFKKGDELFLLDGDFDVLYTLQPDPEYTQRLNAFRSEFGRDPLGYVALDQCARKMCNQIHDQMRRFPRFKEYFSMLNVINFFSSYFMTLKAHDTIPYLPPMTLSEKEETRCPSVLPELPILSKEPVKNLQQNMIWDGTGKQLGILMGLGSIDLRVGNGKSYANLLADYLTEPGHLPSKELRAVTKDLIWRRLKAKNKGLDLYAHLERNLLLVSGLALSLFAGTMQLLVSFYRPSLNKLNRTFSVLMSGISDKYYRFCLSEVAKGSDSLRSIDKLLREIKRGIYANRYKTAEKVEQVREVLKKIKRIEGGIPKKSLVMTVVTMVLVYYVFSEIRWYFSRKKVYHDFYLPKRAAIEKNLDQFVSGAFIDLKRKFYAYPSNRSSPEETKNLITCLNDFTIDRMTHSTKNRTLAKSFILDFVNGRITGSKFKDLALPVLKPALDSGDKERQVARNVVGGCGMNLTGKKVTRSEKAEELFRDKWPVFSQAEEEKWSVATLPTTGEKGAVFGLTIGQAPVEQTDYRWMESLLQKKGDDSDRFAHFYEITQAMADDDEERFAEQLPLAEAMKDRMGRTLLHMSAMISNQAYTKTLYKKGLSPKDRDVHGFLPIHYAAMEGNIDQIEYLGKVDRQGVLAQSYSGLTPLMVAAQHGQLAGVKALIGLGARLNGVTAGGYTPLMISVHEGNFEMTQYLLGRGELNVNVATGRKVTPLMLAAELKDVRLLELLLEKRADPNARDRGGNKAINVAIQCGNAAGVALLAPKTVYTKEIGGSLARYGTTKTIEAFLTGHFSKESVLEMIEFGVDQGNSKVVLCLLEFLLKEVKGGLGYATERFQGNVKSLFEKRAFSLIKRLMKAQVSFPEKEMIEGICIAGDHPLSRRYLRETIDWKKVKTPFLMEMFDILLARRHIALIPLFMEVTGLEVKEKIFNEKGWEYPHMLAKIDGRNLLRDWIDDGDDCLYPVKGDQPLTLPYIAAMEGNYYTLEYLLEYMEEAGISLDGHYQDRHLLMGAFASYHERVILRTLGSLTDVNRGLDGLGTTAAHLAAGQNRVSVLKEVTRREGKLDIKDKRGQTPLYAACISGSFEAAVYLIEKGAYVTLMEMQAVKKLPEIPTKKAFFKLFKEKGVEDIETKEETLFIEVPEMLDGDDLERFNNAETLSEKITASKELPLEKRVPPDEMISRSVPLIFYLVQCSIHAPDSYLEEVTPLILRAAKEYPNLKDAQGNTLSHSLVLLNLSKFPDIKVDFKAKNAKGQTPLHMAAALAKDQAVEAAVKRVETSDLEAIDDAGETPLFYAARKNRLFPVTVLLRRQANPNHRNMLNQTPFYIAFAEKNSRILLTLLRYCDVDQEIRLPGKEGETTTPLECLAASHSRAFIHALRFHSQVGEKRAQRFSIPHILAQGGELEPIRHMMRVDRELFFKKKDALYPWDWAAVRGHLPLIEYFFHEIPNLFATHGENLLTYAAVGGQKDIAAFLVDKGILDHLGEEERQEALSGAAASNCKETAQFFTDLFVDIKSDHYLFKGAAKAIPQGLYSHRVNALPQFYEGVGFPIGLELEGEETGLHMAARVGAFKATKYLMGRPEADPTQRATRSGLTVLESAAEGSNAAQFRYLLEKTLAPIDQQNEEKQTLLHLAARKGHLPHIMLLLERGYDPNIEDMCDLTPQEIAAIEGRGDILRLLLFCGADEASIGRIKNRAKEGIAKKDYLRAVYEGVLEVVETFQTLCRNQREGETPLHLAVRSGWKVALVVLARSELLDEADAKGWTPLHLAAAMGNVEALRLLLINGARQETRNQEGKTAQDVASGRAKKLFEELEKGGQDVPA